MQLTDRQTQCIQLSITMEDGILLLTGNDDPRSCQLSSLSSVQPQDSVSTLEREGSEESKLPSNCSTHFTR